MSENNKVTLLLVYPDYFDNSTKNAGGNYSEGLASISAVCKAAGHNVELYHLKYPRSKEEFQQGLKEFNYDIIGFSVRTTAFDDVKKMIAWTREVTDAFIFCGSYHATIATEEVIAVDGVDGACIGEGEYPVRELCDRYKSGDFKDIESFWFKDNGEIIKNPVRPLLLNLDELPFPDHELFDYPNLESCRIKTALVMLSRGCLFSCTYCGNSQFRMAYPNRKHYCRFRSPENSISLLEELLRKYPWIEYINFRDAIFNMYDDWFFEFIKMYKEKINLPFTCNTRLDSMTEDVVREMKEAGCYLIDVGVETGDDYLRKTYLKRHMTNEQMKSAFKLFHKYNIPSMTYNIIGLPYETLEKALSTIKINVELNPDRVIPNIFYPYPGTILADIAREAGTVPDPIPAGTVVPLHQDAFPEHEVLYASNYFMKYIKRYKRCRKMPKWLGVPLEKMYDKMFLSKLTPRKFLNKWCDFKRNVWRRIREFIIKKMPSFYLKLRKMRLKMRASSEHSLT